MFEFRLWLEKHDSYYVVTVSDPNDIVYLLDRVPTLTIIDINKIPDGSCQSFDHYYFIAFDYLYYDVRFKMKSFIIDMSKKAILISMSVLDGKEYYVLTDEDYAIFYESWSDLISSLNNFNFGGYEYYEKES